MSEFFTDADICSEYIGYQVIDMQEQPILVLPSPEVIILTYFGSSFDHKFCLQNINDTTKFYIVGSYWKEIINGDIFSNNN